MALNKSGNAFPLISLIIATYNRKDELEGLLSCLTKQTLPTESYEIIVIDDGSTDSTPNFLKEMVNSGKRNLTFCCQINSGPGAARNRGMDMARARIFPITDTDCRPFPDWLKQLIQPFNDEKIGVVGGAEDGHGSDSQLMHAIHFCMTCSITTGGIRGKKGVKLARYYPRTFNMAISRKAFLETGGFKPLYHGEDIELSFRIKKAGFTVSYNPDAKVFHKRRCSMPQFLCQVFKMGEARVNLACMHPQMLEILHIIPSLCIILSVFLLVLSFFSVLGLKILILLFFSGICFTCLMELYAFRQRKNIEFLILVPIIFFLQQFGYGTGFMWGLLRKPSLFAKIFKRG